MGLRGCLRTVVMVVMVVMVMGVRANQAASTPSVTIPMVEELMVSLMVNQLAILKDMNASSTACDSRGTEFQELRLLRQDSEAKLQALEAATKNHLKGMTETEARLQVMEAAVNNSLQAIREVTTRLQNTETTINAQLDALTKCEARLLAKEQEMKDWEQAVEEKVEERLLAVEQKVEEKIQAVEQVEEGLVTAAEEAAKASAINTSSGVSGAVTPDLDALHNDTQPSLCGNDKVLYGSRGSLSSFMPFPIPYQPIFCKWSVVLPEGTRPVFHWGRLEMRKCYLCECNMVKVLAPDLSHSSPICGSKVPASHEMYEIKSNQFNVTFSTVYNPHANTSKFLLSYSAIPYP